MFKGLQSRSSACCGTISTYSPMWQCQRPVCSSQRSHDGSSPSCVQELFLCALNSVNPISWWMLFIHRKVRGHVWWLSSKLIRFFKVPVVLLTRSCQCWSNIRWLVERCDTRWVLMTIPEFEQKSLRSLLWLSVGWPIMVKLDRFQEIQLQIKKNLKKHEFDAILRLLLFIFNAERSQIKSGKCFPRV